ncbi:MAG: exo-alpha-sialidase [Rhodospirillaceae bacterium]|jgi:photosystem II stability/assembly factor-like uncharacterized protein|nr:exo-alpha-sialidase [Rhodospirillaceae bacterium]MBT4687573.1 exo-alpha-sialidase [Rhodospirillaceae bacterium]MBT5082067.1 exo-alpha-sialidase [Rhodospirillaceae bacterium]MBT5524725.1 exo-alpha-sialidase [Rhodospirillaceae bacterium]MBT5881234.1 exo-alpha-sialidase [Rhodospirillaceae bacterium]
MKVLAGTGRGIFLIDAEASGQDIAPRRVLESRGVRDLVTYHDRLFAGTGAGLYLSKDGGESWSLSGMEDREVWQIRSAGNGTLYAGTQPAGLFRSDDAGDSWREVEAFAAFPQAADWCIPVDPVLPGRARALVIDQDDPQRIWVGVEVGGIMRTRDGGDTWALDLPGKNPDLHMMCAQPDRPEVLYASTGYGRLDGVAEMIEGNAGVFRSDDGGESWQYAWKGITPPYSRPMCIDPRSPYELTVASAPTAFSSFKDAGGAQAVLLRSEDGGESWRSLCDPAHSPSEANIHGLTPDLDKPGGVVIGTDNGEVWRVSEDADWTLLGSGLPAVLSAVTLPA